MKDLMRIYVEGCKKDNGGQILNEHSSQGHTVLIIRATSDYKAGNAQTVIFGGGVAGDKESETAACTWWTWQVWRACGLKTTPIANTPSAAKIEWPSRNRFTTTC